MTSEPLRAAVVGLGRVAWKFDQEPGRRVVWSHVGAYDALAPRIKVVGACDVQPKSRAEFIGKWIGIPVFETAAEMIKATDPQIISICTPGETHRATVEVALTAPNLKVIWCEKPLATSLDDAKAIVQMCEQRQIVLVVSHVRRWSSLWRRFAKRIAAGDVGTVRHLRISMPNRLWSIGSHAVDLAVMLGGMVGKAVWLDVPALAEEGEPARPALVLFESGVYAVIEVTGMKDRLIVEAEATGDRGRLRAREDTGEIILEPFVSSRRYQGYLEPGPAEIEKAATLTEESAFVAVAEETIALARDSSAKPTCGGRDALETMRVLELMAS